MSVSPAPTCCCMSFKIPVAQQNSGHGQRLAHAMTRVGWNRNKSGLVSINGRSVRGYVRRDATLPAHAAMAPDGEGTNLPNREGLVELNPVEVPPTDALEQGLAQGRVEAQADLPLAKTN